MEDMEEMDEQRVDLFDGAADGTPGAPDTEATDEVQGAAAQEDGGSDSDGGEVADSDELETLRRQHGELNELFATNPMFAEFVNEWREGGDPFEIMLEYYGDDLMEAIEQDGFKDKLRGRLSERAAKAAEDTETEAGYEAQFQENLAKSAEILEDLAKEQGRGDEECAAAVEFLVEVTRKGLMGEYGREDFERAFAAVNHDQDVERAAEDAEIRGRNAKIEERLRTAPAAKGDGTPNLGGRMGSSAGRELAQLGALDRYGDNSTGDIWKRGAVRRRQGRR